METFTDQDLIKELQEYDPPIEMRTGGVTQQEWGKAQGIDTRAAGDRLNDLLAAGKLHRVRQRCADGFIRWVYYKP